MTKLFGFVLLFLFCCLGAFAQAVLRGKVIGEDTKKPLAAVSVYLNNTSLGAVTNDDGVFIITKIPSGEFRLVASCVGYETYVNMIDPRTVGKDFIISMKPNAEELQGFTVTTPDPEGWKKWGKLFTELFIGDTPGSNDCKLTNP